MPRRARSLVGGYAYHVLNRANGRLRLFRKDADFAAFEQVLREAHDRVPLRILGEGKGVRNGREDYRKLMAELEREKSPPPPDQKKAPSR